MRLEYVYKPEGFDRIRVKESFAVALVVWYTKSHPLLLERLKPMVKL